MKKYLLQMVSYVLVAAVASAVTMLLFNRSDKLDRLAALIEARFIGEADQTAMEDAAASAMVDSLADRWSHYIPADEYQAYLEQLNNAYVGVGITISVREDGLGFDVMQVTAGGPAEEAGVLAGDILTHVEGQSVAQLGTDASRNLIRGKEGTQVALTILRDGEAVDISVTRRSIQTPVATGTLLNDSVGLVRIVNFDSRCASETIAAIEELIRQGATSLIFDVRNNPGGYKSELVAVLDYLLPEGVLFRSELYNGQIGEDRSDADHLDMPMAVLVNGESYSAAEFFAAALWEYEAAVTLGEQTCGKGYFQQTFELGDGSAVGLSIGKYYTPKGVSLAGVGVTLDVVVEVDDLTAGKIYYEQLTPEEDPQIQAAILALTGTENVAKEP